MKRQIIHIDETKCNGCGLCVNACHEGALQLIDGKAKLVSESYCDGLGACLPACPVDAIWLEERDAAEFDETAVKQMLGKKEATKTACGCPGSQARTLLKKEEPARTSESLIPKATQPFHIESQLRQWPVQIKLVPVSAPYLQDAHLLIAADCSAFAYGNFHEKFMKNKVTLIGCPKLDEGDYSEKLAAILTQNNIKSLTVVRMEVPCCGGIANAAKQALMKSGKMIPWSIVTLSTDGSIRSLNE